MVRWLVGWSLRFRLLVLGIAGATMLFGVTRLGEVPVEVVPDFTPPYVEIQTEALGLSAEEVEQLITVPLEADLLHGVAFLQDIQSESVAGLSSIVMTFQPGTDIYRARQVVTERLAQAHALPNVSKPPTMLQPLSSASRVLMVGLTSQDVSLIDLSVLTRWTIRPRLMGVPGVANVAVWGQRERQLQVLVDPDRLRSERVQLPHVVESTGNALWVSPLTFLDASTPGTGGFIDTPNQRLGVQHIFPIREPDDLAQVPISPEDVQGRIIRLGDVATVVEDHQPLIGDAVVDGGEGLLLVIEKFPGADTLEVTRGIEAAMTALQPGLTGVQIDTTVYRPATFLEEAMGNIGLALLAGLVLVVVVLAALFRGWRPALVGAVTIPLSVAASALALHLLGSTLNLVVAAGLVLAIAVVVDDAIGGVEDVRRRMRNGHGDDESPMARVAAATIERRGPTTVATLVVLIAVAPLLLIDGAVGAFLPPLLLAAIVAIAVSTLVASTVTPALASLLLRHDRRRIRETAAARRLAGAYEAGLVRLLPRSGLVVAASTVAAAAVIAVAGSTILLGRGDGFLPTFRERDILVRWDAAPGTSRPEMTRVVQRASAELRSVPGVRNVGAHVGRAVTSDEIVGIGSAELWVSVDPAADHDATLAAIRAVVDGYPGTQRAVATYTTDRVADVLTSTDDDVVVRVYGQSQQVIETKAGQVADAIVGIDGIHDVQVTSDPREPSLLIEVDLDKAEQFGLRPGDVRRTAATLLSGIEVGLLFEDQKVFEVVVWGKPELRTSITSIRNLPLQTPTGQWVTLGDVADVRIGPAPVSIRREGVFRYADVTATVVGRDLASATQAVRDVVGAIPFPLEYRAEVIPAGVERQAGLIRLGLVALAAVAGIMLLLQAAFGSWRLATFLVLALPVALAGAGLGLLVTGGEVSLGIIAGALGVMALATRNAVLLVDRAQRLQRNGTPDGGAAVVEAARGQLVPVLATAIAVAFVALPFLVLGDRAGFELLRPVAAVLVGGMATSLVVSLFLVPAMYLRAGPSPEPDPATRTLEQPGFSPA